MISSDLKAVRQKLDALRADPTDYAQSIGSAIAMLEAAERDVHALETNAVPLATVYALSGEGYIRPQALS